MVATFENISITMMLWSWNVLQLNVGVQMPYSVSVHMPYSVSVQIPYSVSVQILYSVSCILKHLHISMH
jgi:hypothetical protein